MSIANVSKLFLRIKKSVILFFKSGFLLLVCFFMFLRWFDLDFVVVVLGGGRQMGNCL